MHRTARSPGRSIIWALCLCALFVVAGCGSDDSYKNDPRPPAPINVAAYISATRITVSPATFGAGPVVVIVTNQSDTSQEATFESELGGGTNSTLTQSTGPINPGDTGEIKVDVPEGAYRLRTGSDIIRPATVAVGAQRESAQNDVLQP